jgi:hypothetical protein
MGMGCSYNWQVVGGEMCLKINLLFSALIPDNYGCLNRLAKAKLKELSLEASTTTTPAEVPH